MTARRVLTGLVLVALVLLGWVLLAPQQLGGQVAVVTTFGNSMLPTYTANDLVVVMRQSSYDIGDVVAYHSDELNTVVLHRIVDGDDDGYVTSGDNNDWLDPDRPTDDQLMGTAQLRIPQAGRLLAAPPLLRAGIVVALATAALFVGGRPRRRRGRRPGRGSPAVQLLPPSRRRRSPRPADPDSMSPSTGGRFAWVGWPQATALTAVAAGVLAILLAVVAFTRPTTEPGQLSYTHRGQFTYSADAPSGVVYPDGEVSTGDPVFLRLVDTVDVAFAYSLDGPVDRIEEATGQLWVDLAHTSGWSTRLPLSRQETADGGELVLNGTLDVPQLQRTLQRIADQTGIASGSATLTLTAEVDVRGAVGGRPVSEPFVARLDLQLDEARLTPQVEEPDADRELTVSEDASVTVPGLEPARLEIAGQGMEVGTARVSAVALFGAALLTLAVAAVGAVRRRGLDEASRIQVRYGSQIVEVAALELPAGYGIVDVRDIDALVNLARQVDRPMLHHRVGDDHTYIVEGDAAVYRHRLVLVEPS